MRRYLGDRPPQLAAAVGYFRLLNIRGGKCVVLRYQPFVVRVIFYHPDSDALNVIVYHESLNWEIPLIPLISLTQAQVKNRCDGGLVSRCTN